MIDDGGSIHLQQTWIPTTSSSNDIKDGAKLTRTSIISFPFMEYELMKIVQIPIIAC